MESSVIDAWRFRHIETYCLLCIHSSPSATDTRTGICYRIVVVFVRTRTKAASHWQSPMRNTGCAVFMKSPHLSACVRFSEGFGGIINCASKIHGKIPKRDTRTRPQAEIGAYLQLIWSGTSHAGTMTGRMTVCTESAYIKKGATGKYPRRNLFYRCQ